VKIVNFLDFETSSNTMAIVPEKMEDQRIGSRVLETNDEFVVPTAPLDIIKKSCHMFGSSFEGRREGAIQLIGVTRKHPILIDYHLSICFFPTTSPKSPNCFWISPLHVFHHEEFENFSTNVIFQNYQQLIVPISRNSFENQLYKATLLYNRYGQNIERIEKKTQLYRLNALEHKTPYLFSHKSKSIF